MATVNVTFDNYEEFPVGTEVIFNFGAMYPTCEGKITGWKVEPATKHFDPMIWLEAEYECPREGRTVKTRIIQFTDVGIGTYLKEVYMNR